MTDNPHARYFSPDYDTARSRFLQAAETAGATVERAFHPHATGPGGIDLSMDMAVLGAADASSALVMISGTHGPEGYCGSGVQTGMLASGMAGELAAHHRIVLIHAHNPYGFAWDTRFNEDNIDLNRNYLPDFTAPLPANPSYDAIAAAAAPASRDPDALEAAEMALLTYARDHGFGALQQALTGGQYTHPQGVYFGGTAPSWSNLTIQRLFSAGLEGIERLACIDMHTGLGPFGVGEIICEAAPGSAHFTRAVAAFGDDICSTKDGTSVSAELQGTLDTALLALAGSRWSAVIALEFGTVDPMSVFRATQASSWLHVHGDRNGPDARDIRQASRDAFYPQDPAWTQAVWDRATSLMAAAGRHLAA
ncbi:MAG: M14 family metallopeptidase [Hyphomonadaceae bacterium]|jgi:hypothetical protein|nr:M14 family metallopeptidase [Hyphomonadaceae bacterium]